VREKLYNGSQTRSAWRASLLSDAR